MTAPALAVVGDNVTPWLPHNLEAEQALLGALLMSPEAFFSVDGLTQAPHFYEGLHGRLFEAIRQHARRGIALEPALLQSRLEGDAAWQELGGLRYLGLLIDRAPSPSTAPDYAREIAEKFTRRELIRVGGEIAAIGREGGDDADALVGAAEKQLSEVSENGPTRAEFINGGTVIREAIAHAQKRNGAMDAVSGLRDVDDLTGGFGRGEVSIIAGRPGMAKSLAGSQIAKANSMAGKGSLFFSQEMGVEPLGLRLACDVAYERGAPVYSSISAGYNPTFDAARKGRLTPEQWQRLSDAQEVVSAWPLAFDVRPNLTVSQMEAAARRKLREWERQGVEPGCVVVDHMGLIRPEHNRNGNKVAETTDVSQALARMAKNLDMPLVVLCQLSREVEKAGRASRIPNLSDLNWSGAIEQDARLVMFLYRPAYYLRPPEDPTAETMEERIEREAQLDRVRNQLRWIVAKASNGQPGQVETFIDIGCAAIRDREAA